METASFIVEDHQSTIRIDKFLSEKMEGISRSQIQKLIENNKILLNSKPVLQCRIKVQSGDQIDVHDIPENTDTIQPQDMPLSILYEDEHLLFVNKTAGIPIHPAGHRKRDTLVNALLYHVKSLSTGSDKNRPGIVHRLDQGTSGVVVIAKDDDTHEKLTDMFKERSMKKVYWAIVHGVPVQNDFEVCAPIMRNPTERKKMIVHANGKPCVTRFHLFKQGLGGSLVEVYPFTGRTHQIRVHLQHIGHPVVSDPLYCKKKFLHRGQLERSFEEYPGFGLHAKSLSFIHPQTDREIKVEAPLPEIFTTIVDQMT